MNDDDALAWETIWLGCGAYGALPDVEVGDHWYLTGIGYRGFDVAFLLVTRLM